MAHVLVCSGGHTFWTLLGSMEQWVCLWCSWFLIPEVLSCSGYGDGLITENRTGVYPSPWALDALSAKRWTPNYWIWWRVNNRKENRCVFFSLSPWCPLPKMLSPHSFSFPPFGTSWYEAAVAQMRDRSIGSRVQNQSQPCLGTNADVREKYLGKIRPSGGSILLILLFLFYPFSFLLA